MTQTDPIPSPDPNAPSWVKSTLTLVTAFMVLIKEASAFVAALGVLATLVVVILHGQKLTDIQKTSTSAATQATVAADASIQSAKNQVETNKVLATGPFATTQAAAAVDQSTDGLKKIEATTQPEHP